MGVNLSYDLTLMRVIGRYNVEFRSSPFRRRIQLDWLGLASTHGHRHTGMKTAFVTGWNVKSRDGAELLCDILLTEFGNRECIHRRGRLGKNGTNVVHYFVIRTKVLLETINE